MEARKAKCYSENKTNLAFGPEEKFCEHVFDDLMCWPATKAGNLAIQPCPHLDLGYTETSTTSDYASRLCETNGSWFFNPEHNRQWTNYTMCTKLSDYEYDNETWLIKFDFKLGNHSLHETWIPIIKSVSHVGYWISIFTLVSSIIILISIKKLKCPRNLLHVHLFLSFIMRAAMFIIKYLVFHDGIGTRSDIVVLQARKYITENYTSICKAIVSCQNYFIQCNYFFILMEGIYLHNLMFLKLFSDQSSIRIYYIIGWGIPMILTLIWVCLRASFDDDLCWTTSKNKYFQLLIQLPIEASVLINFVLFMRIARVLCSKINSMYVKQRKMKYRRLIKSTLTLVSIYSVPYTFSIAMKHVDNNILELVWIAADQIFTANQGLMMALIYCLMNNEVQGEIVRKYNSFRENFQQNKRVRTISNTQQSSMPLQEDPIINFNDSFTKHTEQLC